MLQEHLRQDRLYIFGEDKESSGDETNDVLC